MTERRVGRLWRWGAPALLVAVGVVAAVLVWPDDDPEPVDVTTSAPVFATVAELTGASDLVVVATVIADEPGRLLTDPADPDAGVRTTLYELSVETVLAGDSAARTVVLEHETALVDGTPVTLDGVAAPEVGERGIFFLLAGSTDEFPHHAVVGSQGRFPFRGEKVVGLSDDPLSAELDGLAVEDLIGPGAG